MTESKRQKQVASVIIEAMNDIFRNLNLHILHGGMVSIASVKLTPDLLEARVYLSFFKIEDTDAALKHIEEKSWEIKKQLSSIIKLQLRRIPVLKFYMDDSLAYVEKINNLFKDIDEGKV